MPERCAIKDPSLLLLRRVGTAIDLTVAPGHGVARKELMQNDGELRYSADYVLYRSRLWPVSVAQQATIDSGVFLG